MQDELELAATIDSAGHVNLSVLLLSGPFPLGWTLQAVLLLVAGSLEQIARQVEKFMEQGKTTRET